MNASLNAVRDAGLGIAILLCVVYTPATTTLESPLLVKAAMVDPNGDEQRVSCRVRTVPESPLAYIILVLYCGG